MEGQVPPPEQMDYQQFINGICQVLANDVAGHHPAGQEDQAWALQRPREEKAQNIRRSVKSTATHTTHNTCLSFNFLFVSFAFTYFH